MFLTVFERAGAGISVLLSVMVQRDTKVCFIRNSVIKELTGLAKVLDKIRSGRDRALSVGEEGHPPAAPNSFERSLNSLYDLMERISSDSGVSCLYTERSIQ